MRDSPNQLRRMPIIRMLDHPLDDGIPRLTPRFARLLGEIVRNVVEERGWRAARGVHGEIETALPFQETDFVGGADPGGFEEGGVPDGAVDAMHVVKVELDFLGGVLGSAGEVDCIS